jgi:histidinol-phosphate aminotransferase
MAPDPPKHVMINENGEEKIKEETSQMSSWEDQVRKVTPYTPGEQPQQKNVVKLNTNENPYPPSPMVAEAIRQTDTDALRLYPDPTAGKLVRAIADYYRVKPSQVFVGVGSDDVIAMCFLTLFNSDRPVLFPDITYSFYEVWAEAFRVRYRKVPLNDSFGIDPEDYACENGGVIFPNPNAPTGIEMPQDSIEKIVKANPDTVVIVDEAYVDFGARSALPLVEKYDNLLVVQTFSKSRQMAGMRIGFAIGSEKLIRYLSDMKYSFNSYTMNRVTIEAGTAAIADDAYFKETCRKIAGTREWAKEEFRRRGFTFGDSMANFIFVKHSSVPASRLFERLREKNIFVRYFRQPRIDNYLRVTVGTREQMEKLFAALDEMIPGGGEQERTRG